MHNKFIRLAVAAGVALLLAFWVGKGRQPESALATGQRLVPDLADALNDLTEVRLTGAGNRVIATLRRSGRGWVSAEKPGYPADMAKLKTFLLRLSDAELLEPKTADPKRYTRLGVQDTADAAASGVQVQLEGLKSPVRLIVGHYNGKSGESTFVRRVGEDQSYLAKGNLVVDAVSINWLQRDFLDVPAARVAEVALRYGDTTVRVFKDRESDLDYRWEGLPKGREWISPDVANQLAGALSSVRLEDVLEQKKAPAPTAPVSQTRYRTFDGLEIEVTTWALQGKHYATFTARFDEQAAQRQFADGEENAARAQKLADARREAQDLAQRLAPWVFVIPEYKFSSMHPVWDGLLKPVVAAAPKK